MRVLVTGASGMLGRTLCRHLGPRRVVSTVTRAEADLRDPVAVQRTFRHQRPDVVLHTAAYTKVDQAESEPERAFADNALASAQVAAACREVGARLIAFSTDYVFAGDGPRPYHEWDPIGPKSVYGSSKLAAEEAIRNHCPNHLILRIAWLYGQGGPSFVHAIVSRAKSGQPLKVVDDQHGNPTSCLAVAELVERLLDVPLEGTAHATCEGETTWFGFAQHFLRQLDLQPSIEPCGTDAFPRPAPRPANSRLDNVVLRQAGLPAMTTWQRAIEQFLEDHRDEF